MNAPSIRRGFFIGSNSHYFRGMKKAFLVFIGLLVATFCFVGDTNASDFPKDLYDLVIGIDVDDQDLNAVSAYVFDIDVENDVGATVGIFILINDKVKYAIFFVPNVNSPPLAAHNIRIRLEAINKAETDRPYSIAHSMQGNWHTRQVHKSNG